MKFHPRDFLETAEGLVFAVVDGCLEDDRVLGFLRYAPEAGNLKKVSTQAANRLLRDVHPHYLHHSARLQADLHSVPLAAIRRHHRPRERVAEVLREGPKDPMEAKLRKLLRLLIDQGIAPDTVGVTGSLLIRRHGATSDLDVVIYGQDNFFRARSLIRKEIAAGTLSELDAPAWQDAYQRRGCALDFEDFLRHERRKGNKGCVDGTKFDLALVEETPPPDPVRWRKTGPMTIEARVLDDSGSFRHPARYTIDHPDIGEVLVFTHTYVGQAEAGEPIEAAGIVEESEAGDKRLVIGSSREAPGEYIRVLW